MEKDLMLWLQANWPSVIVGMMTAAAYVRLNRFVRRLEKNEARVKCLCDLHAERHGDDAVKIYRAGETDE